MLQMNNTYKRNKPSATITRLIQDDDENSHTLCLTCLEKIRKMRIGRMNKIISSAVGDGVEVKNSEDVFYLMEIFFKQEEKCTDKIEDRLAKINC